MDAPSRSQLRVIRAGIDTYQQPVLYMHRDCEVCRSEGCAAMARVHVQVGTRAAITTPKGVVKDFLELDEAALSAVAWRILQSESDALTKFGHPEPAASELTMAASVLIASTPVSAEGP